jgi:hypothetical protein
LSQSLIHYGYVTTVLRISVGLAHESNPKGVYDTTE